MHSWRKFIDYFRSRKCSIFHRTSFTRIWSDNFIINFHLKSPNRCCSPGRDVYHLWTLNIQNEMMSTIAHNICLHTKSIGDYFMADVWHFNLLLEPSKKMSTFICYLFVYIRWQSEISFGYLTLSFQMFGKLWIFLIIIKLTNIQKGTWTGNGWTWCSFHSKLEIHPHWLFVNKCWNCCILHDAVVNKSTRF